MTKKYFNFNNEADLTPVEVDDETGRVTFTMGEETSEFESLQEFAEFYAVARNVVPENLKNWVLTEDGNQFAFVLRAGTAGLDTDALSAMVASFRAAGMNPEEIGRAVAAAQESSEAKTREASEEETRVQAQETVAAVVDTFKGVELNILKEHFDAETKEELIESVNAIPSVLEYENKNYDEDDTDDEGYNDEPEYLYDEDAVRARLNDVIDEVAHEVSEDYPDLPLAIAYDYSRSQVGENADGADELIHKALFAAKIAHRGLEVTLVDDEGDISGNEIVAADDIDDDIVYKVGRRYFIVTE